MYATCAYVLRSCPYFMTFVARARLFHQNHSKTHFSALVGGVPYAGDCCCLGQSDSTQQSRAERQQSAFKLNRATGPTERTVPTERTKPTTQYRTVGCKAHSLPNLAYSGSDSSVERFCGGGDAEGRDARDGHIILIMPIGTVEIGLKISTRSSSLPELKVLIAMC